MGLFLGLGIGGTVLLAFSLVFDGLLEGVSDGALGGLFDGWLSLPVIAGFVSMLGFTGAIVLGTTGLGPGAAAAAGAVAGTANGWLTYRFSRALARDGSAGAPRLSRTVADNVAQGMELLGSTTGVDLAQLLKGLTAAKPETTGEPVSPNGNIAVTG
ncbi:hypothetical protein ACFYP6_33840 [Streptomyces goshikiensis]|uniref:hypothetical protein n=1 Tax=Streptomyces goshikiensis TaxID=1942 RepID=UPI00369EC82A